MSMHPNTFTVICNGVHPQVSGARVRRRYVPSNQLRPVGQVPGGVLICLYCDGAPQDQEIQLVDVPANISQMVP